LEERPERLLPERLQVLLALQQLREWAGLAQAEEAEAAQTR
jgi:hypothetical protein